MIDKQKQEAKLFLDGMNIFIIRNIARLIGVAQPTTNTKSKLIDAVIEILSEEFKPDNKNFRGRPVKIGNGMYAYCESILEQLKTILNIEDSLICNAIRLRQQIKLLPRSETLAFNRHVNDILSLCEEQNESEIIIRFILELSAAKEKQKENSIVQIG